MGRDFTPGYEVKKTLIGKRYTFFCDLTGVAVCSVGPITEQNPHKALEEAKTQAKLHFSRCGNCGRWVCDNAFNMVESLCAECAPFDMPDRFCHVCGAPLKPGADACSRCGQEVRHKMDPYE